jgi:hypothetical protein
MKVDIQFIKETQRFPFRFIDFLNGLFLILPTTLILLSALMIRSYNVNNMAGLNGLLITSLIIGLLGLSLVILIVKRLIQNLKFTKIATGLDFASNVELINKVFCKLYAKQSIDSKKSDNGLLLANSGISMFSWGEINTAVCDDNVIYINSRPTGQPVTIFENRLNIKRITKLINEEKSPAHNTQYSQ